MRVVVTGAAGQLGAALVEEFRQSHETVALTRRELDVADDAAVAATMDRLQPDVIVNCVAYNFVDLAEDHPIDALGVNAFAVRALARAAQRRGAALVHYSTDFVFDGTAMLPYTGSRSAPAAERVRVVEAARRVVRARRAARLRAPGREPVRPRRGWAGAEGQRRGHSQDAAGGRIADRVRRPHDLADLCDRRGADDPAARGIGRRAGLYHCVNSGSCTWF